MATAGKNIVNNNMDDDGQTVAIKWFLHNACTSNAQLAVISDVCQRWRKVAVDAVASEAVALGTRNREAPGEGNSASSLLENPTHSSIRTLMITDMARELVVEQQKQDGSDGGETIPSQKQNQQGDNFCLAWFAPSGIRITSVSIDDDNDTEDGVKAQHGNMRGRKANPSRSVTCCTEWRGYRLANEVLTPFGYSPEFISSVLDASLELADGNSVDAASLTSSPALSHLYNPTFAVRGATLARPEGFCLCVDNNYIHHANSSNFQKPSHAADHRVPSCIDGWMNDYDDNRWPLNKKIGLSDVQRKTKQTSLAKSLLPRMVLSTRRKYPLLHRFAEEDADENEKELHNFSWEKRQRAVQFLNSDKSQAVKLITPNFECGPARGPVTMFVIAVTTEDGCFVSGRSSRFEFGHLYPLCSRDMQFDTSPVSIATGKCEAGEGKGVGTDSISFQRSSTVGTGTTSDDNDENDSTDSEQSMHCLCKFDSGDPFNPKDLSIEDPTEDCVHRGCTGPGLWHCYTAVFDGKESSIRVDGCEEPKRTREHYGLATSDEEDDDADNPINASRFVGSGVLDGLSIGSDHQFDMSLCYGEIEGECGQGAIAELAVFHGQMDESDIQCIEKFLMKKHGILSVQEKKEYVAQENENRTRPVNIECHLEEDEWKRTAHAFIEQRRPWNLEGKIPLRVAANHPSVAWQRTNEITGAPVRITRIGAKHSNGSSDW